MPKLKAGDVEYDFQLILIDLIDTEEQQIREVQVDDDIHELASSIDASSMLQLPGVVPKANGRYDLAWGRRRLEAYKLRKATHLPCRVYHGKLEDVKTLALVENLQRKQMKIEEECKGVADMYERQKLSIDQIVTRLGRTRNWVLQRLAVPNYPPDVREALLESAIPLGTAEALAICEDESARSYILSQAIHAKLPISEVRNLVEASKNLPTQHEAIQAGLEAQRPNIAYQEQFIHCAACNRPRRVKDLIFVRVCNDGCKEVTPSDATTDSH